MKIGMIGLGRMGKGMSRRLLRGGHSCVVYDPNSEAIGELEKDGAIGASGLSDLVAKLQSPKVVWVMVPLSVVERTVEDLSSLLGPGDIVIEGGNGFYRDDIRRSVALAEKHISYLDVGTSGGVWGLERGYCLMIGGEKKAADYVKPILSTLAPGDSKKEAQLSAESGYLYCGPSGAGHFAKMVHNGIEYGLMQAYAEGFDLLKNAGNIKLGNGEKFAFDVSGLAEAWRHGSVIGSWLLDLTAEALSQDRDLEKYEGKVEDTGEGRWAIHAAIEAGVPTPTLSAALFTRFRSRVGNTFAEKLLSAMRQMFGGHIEKK